MYHLKVALIFQLTNSNPKDLRFKDVPANRTVDTDPLAGAVTYIPGSSFYGVDIFVYEVGSNASEADIS